MVVSGVHRGYLRLFIPSTAHMFYMQVFYVTTQRVLLDFITMAVIYVYVYVYIFYHSMTSCMLRTSIEDG
jgi:hypothetical protein